MFLILRRRVRLPLRKHETRSCNVCKGAKNCLLFTQPETEIASSLTDGIVDLSEISKFPIGKKTTINATISKQVPLESLIKSTAAQVCQSASSALHYFRLARFPSKSLQSRDPACHPRPKPTASIRSFPPF